MDVTSCVLTRVQREDDLQEKMKLESTVELLSMRAQETLFVQSATGVSAPGGEWARQPRPVNRTGVGD